MEDAAQLNRDENAALRNGDPQSATVLLRRASALDPGQPALLFNLAAALRACGDVPGAMAALDEALVADPYFIQAIFQKAVICEDAGEAKVAAAIFRDFLDTVPDEIGRDQRFAAAIERARAAAARDDAPLAARMEASAANASRRVRASFAHLQAKRRYTVPSRPS
jgi:cytochrome c-type biogenesis protein CcmH/NrfG